MNVDATALRLIDLLYQGLEDRAAFDAFTESLALALGANASGLSLDLDADNPRKPTSTFGIAPDFLKQYEEYYHYINVHRTGSAGWHPLGSVISTEETCPDRVLLPSEYFNDFLRPQKLCHIFGVILHVGPHRESNLAVYPKRYSNSFNNQSAALVGALVPHLQRVNRMGAKVAAGQVGTQILNSFLAGVVVVSASGKVLLINTRAERIIASSDGIKCCGGVIRATQPREDAKLKLALLFVCGIEKPSADTSRDIATSFALTRRSDPRPYHITVERYFGKPPGTLPGAAILFISDPEEAIQISEKALAQFYGLTAAEARLSNLLLKGSDLTDACAFLRTSRNTGRAHLRSIFGKLDVKSQSQLVATLARRSSGGTWHVAQKD